MLWELYPDRPLLPAYVDSPRGMPEYVARPLHGREGASVRIVTGDREFVSPLPHHVHTGREGPVSSTVVG